MNRWYRSYEGTVSDPKLHEVALVAGVSRSVVIATWHSILESCTSTESACFEITPRRVALILAEKPKTIELVFEALGELSLIADSTVTKWNDRQFKSDTSTERVKRFRNKSETQDETEVKRSGNAPETETETETEKTSSVDEPPPENRGPTVSKEITPVDPLFHAIMDSFKAYTPRFANYQKESVCAKKVLASAKNLSPEDPEGGAKLLLTTFHRLTTGPDRFWSGQPFTPSGLSPLVERVWAEANKGTKLSELSWLGGKGA